MIDRNIFSERLKQLMKDNKITTVALAESLQLKKQSVHTWTTGKTLPTADKLAELAKIFNVSIDYLIGKGIYAQEGQILQHKELIVQALDEYYGGNSFNTLKSMPDYQFLSILACTLDHIDFKEEDGQVTVSIYPLFSSEYGSALSKITEIS